jgi:peroxiredoxin
MVGKTGTAIGGYAPDFELPGTNGTVHHLAKYLETYRAIAVVFLSNQCPEVQLYLDRLKQLQQELSPQGFTLIGINANDAEQYPEEDFDSMKQFAEQNQLNFPYLRDVTQDVAYSFGAEKTPHVFLLNQAGILCYRGGIDDHPESSEAAQVAYLRNAILSMLAGETIAQTITEPCGCALKWRT